jgi:hypothetical protein
MMRLMLLAAYMTSTTPLEPDRPAPTDLPNSSDILYTVHLNNCTIEVVPSDK